MNSLLYLDAAQVAEACRHLDPVGVVTEAFLAVRAGRAAVAPEAALRWTAPDGTAARSLVLPAHQDTAYGCKIINACIGNPDRGQPRASGLILLFDPETASPVCVMDAAHISALRTAAVSVAALSAARGPGRSARVGFLGCGALARAHAELLLTHRPVDHVTVHDVVGERAEALASWLRDRFQVSVGTAGEAAGAMAGTDVVIAATTTTVAYADASWLAEGATFVNVSLDDATEDLLLTADHLFVDDWSLVSHDTTRLLGRLARAGRVTGPGQQPPPQGRAVDADLATLLAGDYERPVQPRDRVVINPFGMGVHDIAFAARVYEHARDHDTGTRLAR